MKKIHVAIGLDDTLIYNVSALEWEIDDTAVLYLRSIQREFNCTFSLIIARPKETYKSVEIIVRQIEKQLGVIFKNIVCTYYSPKGIYCTELDCTILIDDNECFMSDCSIQVPPITTILFGYNIKESNSDCICHTWKEMYNYL